MRTVTRFEDIAAGDRPIVLAAGAFDGVHRGHRAVIEEAQARARANGGQTWVMTFDPHPLKVLRPDLAPALLTSTPHKLQLLREQNVDGCAVLTFTPQFAAIEAEDFIAHLREAVPTLSAMVVGSNWTFGHRARGNVTLLRELGARHGFEVDVVNGVAWNGSPISSTRVRKAVAAGHLDDAAEMLGRPFSIYGTVIHGTKIGRQLGFPTANIDPHNEVRPPAGIYAVRVRVEGSVYPGAAFLSAHPDARKGPPDVVEVYVIDQQMDLYEHELEVLFVRRLRDEWPFEDSEALKAQIARDVDQARAVLAES